MRLSYASPSGCEQARKLSGSYYTPVDVSRFFWNEFFRLRGVFDSDAAELFLKSHTFIEPSVGAGALFFALIEKCLRIGLSISSVAKINVYLVDINADALRFIKTQITKVERDTGVTFDNVSYVHSDYLDCSFTNSSKANMVFGNPPFVSNRRGESKWKNRYADFLEKSVKLAGVSGSVHFIVPLSIAFSRDYVDLRDLVVSEGRKVALSNFDNIPDTLFKSGKPKHKNTNKANSQRCSILSSMPSSDKIVMSTKLFRWPKRRRDELLAKSVNYIDVTEYCFDRQIPRPVNGDVLAYLQECCDGSESIRDYVYKNGHVALHVAGVARNYIGLRDTSSPSVNSLRFRNKRDFLRIFKVVTSDFFFDYWLTVGDGFHVTLTNILEFPLHRRLVSMIDLDLEATSRMWTLRRRAAKSKLNSGIKTLSYDFSTMSISLYPIVVDEVLKRRLFPQKE